MTATQFVCADMGASPKGLHFIVPGTPASNNRTTRRFGNRSVKSAEAIDYQSKVAQYALIAVRKADWKWAACVTIRIVHWDGRLDVDNSNKSILDGMSGIVFPDDRRRFVRSVEVAADSDGGEECVEIFVEPCEPVAEIVRRKCSVCLESRTGVRRKPHICGVCARRRRKASL